MFSFAFILVALLSFCAAASSPSCGCIASQSGWKIDCANVAFVNSSLAYLQGNACDSSKCKTDSGCKRAFYVINAHHDFCFEDDLPETIELGVHTFESFCDQCKILRKFRTGIPVCETPQCSNPNLAIDAMNYLLTNNCTADCAKLQCPQQYKVVRAFHDICDPNDIPEKVEDQLHDVESFCEPQSCNAASAPFDPNVCVSGASKIVPALLLLMSVFILY